MKRIIYSIIILLASSHLYSNGFYNNANDVAIPMQDSLLIVRNIYFEAWNSDKLDTIRSQIGLQSVVEFIYKTQGVYEIGVHSDTRYRKKTAINITQGKAQLIVDYLISKGVPGEKLRAVGYSYEYPLIKNASKEEEHNINRRIEVKIIDK